jgi:hypothetical protein
VRGALRHRVERLIRELDEPVLSRTDVLTLVNVIVQAVRRHVTDPHTLAAIAHDLNRQLSKRFADR